MDVIELITMSKKVVEMIERLPQELIETENALIDCEDEINDINHVIELIDMNAYEGYLIYKDLQSARRRRRELKDKKIELSSLIGIASQDQGRLKGIVKQMGNRENLSEKNRRYKLRKRKEYKEIYGRRTVGVLKKESDSNKANRLKHMNKKEKVNKNGIPIK